MSTSKQSVLSADGKYAYVKVGGTSFYMRVRPAVLERACPTCKSRRGRPCIGWAGLYTDEIHDARRQAK